MRALALVSDAFGASGGIAQYNRDLLTALAARPGSNEIVVLPRHTSADGAAVPSGVRQLRGRRSRLIYSLTALRAALALGPLDFVFCGHLYLSPLAAFIAWLSGAPLWLQLHGMEAWRHPTRAERSAAEYARLVTSVSRYTRRRFMSCADIDPMRIKVVPNTVAACFTPGAKSAALLDRYDLRGRRLLLTVGRLDADERRKGQDKVIEALPEIIEFEPSAVYLIAGDGTDRGRLEALSHACGVADAVRFIGAVAPEELPQLYRLADVFVMPSTQEGFGIVFLEAAASGIPVVGGNADGSLDALADGVLGTVIDQNDRGALVQAIRRALAGNSPDAAGVDRFGFENFARCVGDLVENYILKLAETSAA